MKLLTPFKITEANLTSISIPENDYPVWDVATTYARQDFVISTDTHTIYRSLEDNNLGNNPDLEVAAFADPLIDNPPVRQWQVISATNRWKLFDARPKRLATTTGPLVVEIEPEVFISGIAGFNVSADSVRVEVYAGADLIYDKTKVLVDETNVMDWLSYFTAPFIQVKEFLFDDLPVLGTPRIVVTLAGINVSMGQLIFGQATEIGTTLQPGTSFSGLDFSYVSVNEYGDLETVQRDATRIFDFDVLVERDNLFSLVQVFENLRGGVPAVWIGSGKERIAAVAYGFYRTHSVSYVGRSEAKIDLEIQGVV